MHGEAGVCDRGLRSAGAKLAVPDERKRTMSEIITSQEFQAKVLDADKPVLVDFFATWCGPCKRLAPTIDEIQREMEGKAYVYKVDIDQSQDIAVRYRVSSVPTLILFKDGEPAKKTIGAQPKAALMALFE